MKKSMGIWERQVKFSAVAAGIITFLVFLRALSCGFVNLDDHEYVLNNPLIRQFDAETLLNVFTKPYAGFWMPLTWLSLSVDYHFWGLNPIGYHLTNMVLHSVNAGLVVLIADKILEQRSNGENLDREQDALLSSQNGGGNWNYALTLLLAGLLWGIHPLRVESVAWVTERKDVLNGLFAFSSVLCYLRYVTLCHRGVSSKIMYQLSLLLFICSLMAKSVTVVLPLILLILDWYPLGRGCRNNCFKLIVEKIPFVFASVLMVAVTLHFAKQAHILVSHEDLTFLQRFIVSGNALFEYVRLMVYPVGIMPLHIIDVAEATTYTVKTVVVVVTLVALIWFRSYRGVIASICCFILLILPVLAFLQNGLQAFAARFTYLPSVALVILVAFIFARAADKAVENGQKWVRVALVQVVMLLLTVSSIATFRQIGVWKSTESVWSRVIEIKPSGRAYKERSFYYLMTGNYSAALADMTSSLEYARRAELEEIYNLYAFRGEILMLMGRFSEAVDDYSLALTFCRHASYYGRRGESLMAIGRTSEAVEDFSLAGRISGPLKWLERKECD